MDSSIIHTVIHTRYQDASMVPTWYVIPYLLNGTPGKTSVWEVKTENRPNQPSASMIRLVEHTWNGFMFKERIKCELVSKRRMRRYNYGIAQFSKRVAFVEVEKGNIFCKTYFTLKLPEDLASQMQAILSTYTR